MRWILRSVYSNTIFLIIENLAFYIFANIVSNCAQMVIIIEKYSSFSLRSVRFFYIALITLYEKSFVNISNTKISFS